ncbi:MAG: DNA polymerase III subunit delta' [Gammaproteobacteria bacterium]|nr:DNA polymerase III subunit delta' [Gammaproteobacteria bacterium]
MTRPKLPWHEAQWARFERMRDSGRVPHALMLRGVAGVGKREFADRLAALLLCEGSDRPCGKCRGCRLFESGSHPDFLRLQPEEGRQTIGIDQIRGLIEHVVLTTTYGGYKLVVVEPAEAMTHPAANTLLKTLEEPPGRAVIILVSHRSGALPATIRSRCQMLDFPVPGSREALAWLAARAADGTDAEALLRLAGGVPLRALAMAQAGGVEAGADLFADLAGLVEARSDPVAVAAEWRGRGISEIGGWLISLTSDLIRLRMDADCAVLTHAELRETMQPVARRLDLGTLFELLDQCLELRWFSQKQVSLNEQLLLENLAIRWAAADGR